MITMSKMMAVTMW